MERKFFRGKESRRGKEADEPASGEAETTNNESGASLHHVGLVAASVHNLSGSRADRAPGVDLLSFRRTQTGRSDFWNEREGGADRKCAKRQLAKRSVWVGVDRTAGEDARQSFRGAERVVESQGAGMGG